MSKLNELPEFLQHDPYPTDVFPVITPKQMQEIHKLLLREMNMPLDRLSAQIGRKLREGLISELLNSDKNVQGSDTTGDDSSNEVGQQKDNTDNF